MGDDLFLLALGVCAGFVLGCAWHAAATRPIPAPPNPAPVGCDITAPRYRLPSVGPVRTIPSLPGLGVRVAVWDAARQDFVVSYEEIRR